ncbi:hypothetical protein ABPG75_012795 [Micractinium tetrahymenae]
MPGASQRQQGRWADLPQELVQLTASQLGGQDSWANSLQTAPCLLPIAVLHGPSLTINSEAKEHFDDYHNTMHSADVLCALRRDEEHTVQQLAAAARLSPRLARVRLSGFHGQALQVNNILLALPRTVRALQLDVPYANVVASAPFLTHVHAERAPAEWLAQLRALRPDLQLTS